MNILPDKIRSGATTSVVHTYPEATGSVILDAVSPAGRLSITAVEDPDGTYTFTFPHTQSPSAGIYKYTITDNTETARIELANGKFEMLPDLLTTDGRTAYEIMYDAVMAAIAGRASAVQKSVTVGDKTIQYMTFRELWQAKEQLEEILEEADKGHYSQYYARIKRS